MKDTMLDEILGGLTMIGYLAEIVLLGMVIVTKLPSSSKGKFLIPTAPFLSILPFVIAICRCITLLLFMVGAALSTSTYRNYLLPHTIISSIVDAISFTFECLLPFLLLFTISRTVTKITKTTRTKVAHLIAIVFTALFALALLGFKITHVVLTILHSAFNKKYPVAVKLLKLFSILKNSFGTVSYAHAILSLILSSILVAVVAFLYEKYAPERDLETELDEQESITILKYLQFICVLLIIISLSLEIACTWHNSTGLLTASFAVEHMSSLLLVGSCVLAFGRLNPKVQDGDRYITIQ